MAPSTGLVELVLAASHDHHEGAFARNRAAVAQPDSGGSAGDDGHPAIEYSGHVAPLFTPPSDTSPAGRAAKHAQLFEVIECRAWE
jgi:hypothetical protein